MTEDLSKIKEESYTDLSLTPMKDFLSGKLRVDAVVLVQPWWYADRLLAAHCVKHKVPFFIVDHAPPMFRYTESNGKKSHQYRKNLCGAETFFAYGKVTEKIMRGVGAKSSITVSGSPRIEDAADRVSIYEPDAGIVIYDTSHRMEDSRVSALTAKLAMDLQNRTGKQIYLREHSRSPQKVRGCLKSYILANKMDEAELVAKTDLVLTTLPSSALLLPALFNRHIIGTYGIHECAEVRHYAKIYEQDIFIFRGKMKDVENFLKSNPNYSKFLGQNLKRHSRGLSSADYILSEIRRRT